MERIFWSVGGFALGIFITHTGFAQTPEASPPEGAPAVAAPADPAPQAPTQPEEPAPAAPAAAPAASPPSSASTTLPASPLEAPKPAAPVATPPKRGRSENDPPTLFGRKVALGGFAGVDAAYTRMFGKDGALVGLQAALLLDHRFSVGVAGYGWTNPRPGPDDELGESQSYGSGYFGAVFRYALLRDSPIYPSAGVLVGGGAVVLTQDDDDDRPRWRDRDVDREDVDLFAVIQPDLSLHANLTRWMRLGVTVGYRFSAGVDRFGFDEGDVNGLVAGGNVQFGRF